MKKIVIFTLLSAFYLTGISQSKTMIVYKNGVKCYEALVAATDSLLFVATDTVKDVDGNTYRTLKIGNKLWMIDNLRTTRLNDGTVIPNAGNDNIKYANGVSGVLRTTPAFSWHNNTESNKNIYGGLYNWYAVETQKLAPSGWRVATKEDWSELENYLAANGYNFDGSKTTDGTVTKILKSMSSDLYWSSSPVTGAVGNNIRSNNKSGLSLSPCGYRDGLNFGETGNTAGYWTLSQFDNLTSNNRYFTVNDTAMVQTRTDIKQTAYAIRCVKDVPVSPVAGIITDATITSLNAGFVTRRDAAFESLRAASLVVAPLDYNYQTSTGCPLSRAFSYSLSDFAFKSLWLNANVDQANAALVQNADFYLNNPTYLRDRDSFYWSADEWLRLLEFFGSNGTKAPGRITAATEAKLYQLMFLYMQTWSPAVSTPSNPLPYSEYIVSNTWNVDGSENHHAMQFCTYWHFCKLLKNNATYASQKFPDGTSADQIYTALTTYIKHWIQERAKKGLFVEMANDDYNQETLKGFYNIYDFSPDAELRELSGKLLDLYWATWSQEQIKGMRGGAKARVYRGNQSNGYDGEGGRIFGYKMAYYYLGLTVTWPLEGALFSAVTSDYRMPDVVMDMSLTKSEMGKFEIRERPLGLAADGYFDTSKPYYKLRQDYGGIVRYSYCTPDFIMGSMHIEARPQSDWTMISSQNRWQGVIFDGDPFCRIFPQAQTVYRAYNQHWGVQSKGCLISQALTLGSYSKYIDTMRVYFSPQGLTSRLERGGWVFTVSKGAYAAVKCVNGTYHWDVTGGRWMYFDNLYSPVIIEVGQKADYASYTAFQDKVLALPLSYDGKVLTHKTIYGDNMVFYADKSGLPEINNQPVDLHPTYVFDSPFIKSVYNSGVIVITKNKRKLTLDFTLK